MTLQRRCLPYLTWGFDNLHGATFLLSMGSTGLCQAADITAFPLHGHLLHLVLVQQSVLGWCHPPIKTAPHPVWALLLCISLTAVIIVPHENLSHILQALTAHVVLPLSPRWVPSSSCLGPSTPGWDVVAPTPCLASPKGILFELFQKKEWYEEARQIEMLEEGFYLLKLLQVFSLLFTFWLPLGFFLPVTFES